MAFEDPRAPVSFYEFATRPIRRDWPVFAGGVAFFFVCQYGSKAVMKRLSKRFRSMSEDDQNTWCVRFVACVNSILCTRTFYNFWTRAHHLTDLYDAIPTQVISTELITAYFIWDVIVCLYYQWGFIYTAHAVVSGTGTYLCCWPFGERWHGWFSGAFEMSNVFMHLAEMLSALDMTPTLVHVLKGIFSILFILFRPIGGSYVLYSFAKAIWPLLPGGELTPPHPVGPPLCLAISCALQGLQYAWTGTILRGIGAALGLCEASELGDAKSPTNKDKNKVKYGDDDKKNK